MASTLLEQTRALHEDLERLERVIVKDFKQETKSHKEKLLQGHRVRRRLEQIQESSAKLVKIYADEDDSRREEIASLGGEADLYGKFYDRLKEIKEYHRRFANPDITEAEDDEALLKEEPAVEFTGEEGLGRYLDLHDLYQRFINAKGFGRQLDYYEYVGTFADLAAIPKKSKFSKAYSEYLRQLLAYLESFYTRTQPLAILDKQVSALEEELEQKWEAGQVSGWEDRGRGQATVGSSGIDLDAFDSAEELETVGAERLKEALAALRLKCGGTPRERAERLYSTKGKQPEELDPRLFAKGLLVPNSKSPEELAKQEAAAKAVALLEAKVSKLAALLANVVSDTRGRIEKKQAQTYEEMQAEMEEAEAELADVADSDEDEYIYNPLKLPLGWDGKPIPYWLYKLHGLNQEFKCEICGNYSYWGRRAFEKHFKEWRHQNGMRAMGIPNSKMFFEVTKIDDALALWKSIQERGRGGFNPDVDEELEDASGNVYNKKTYEDLRKQGLI